MSGGYIYQIIHTLDGAIYHLEAHLKLLFEAYYEIYTAFARLPKEQIEDQIAQIIARSRCPRGVSLFIKVSLSAKGELQVEEHQRSLYKGYTMRCVMPRAAIVEFHIPHIEYPTSIRQAVTQAANFDASKRGGELALRHYNGQVDLIEGAQIFGVTERGIITSKVSHSVEHAHCKEVIKSLGIILIERSINTSEVEKFEELFFADHSGITAIKSCGNRYFMSITASRIAEALGA